MLDLLNRRLRLYPSLLEAEPHDPDVEDPFVNSQFLSSVVQNGMLLAKFVEHLLDGLPHSFSISRILEVLSVMIPLFVTRSVTFWYTSRQNIRRV